MNSNGITYTFSAEVWYSEWTFVSLPQDTAEEIRAFFKDYEEGWGRLKTTAKIGHSEWKTAIWFDTKSQTYLLPIKAAIRKKENISLGQTIEVVLWFAM